MRSRTRRNKQSTIGRRLFAERLEDRRLLAVLFEHGPSDAVRVLVPTQAEYSDLGFDWTGVAEPFDDSAWTQVSGQPNGVGFDRGSGAYDSAIGLDVEASMYEQSTTLFARATFDVGNATAVGKLSLNLRYDDGFIAWLNGIEVARSNVTEAYPAWNARATAEYEAPLTPVESDLSVHVSQLRDGENVLAIRLLNDSPTGDDALLQFTLRGESREGPPLAVDDVAETLEGQPITIDVLANDREGSDAIDPTTVRIATPPQHGAAVVSPNGTITYTPSGIYNGPDSFTYTVRDASGGGQASTQTFIAANAQVRTLVPTNNDLGITWRGEVENFNDAAWNLGAYGVGYDMNPSGTDFSPFVNHNVLAMRNVNRTIYMRSAFALADPEVVQTLTLRMRYDDGFTAFLNGVQIAGGNAPGSLTFDSGAVSGSRTDAQSTVFESFDATPFISALRPGTNILAIHGLNQTLDSSDLLMQPELIATVVPQGVRSNAATVTVDIIGVEHPPIGRNDSYQVDEGAVLNATNTAGIGLILGPGQFLWPTETGGNGHVYERVNERFTWNEALQIARARNLAGVGGHLATITSAAEQQFLASVMVVESAWIGAYQDLNAADYSEPFGGWRWITGEPWAYTNWYPDEPNNQGNEHYAASQAGHRWNDNAEDQTRSGFWVEYPVANVTARQETLIATGSEWKFFDAGQIPPTDAEGRTWKELGYADSTWASGPAQLGYGDGDETTIVDCGPSVACNSGNYITTWFRKAFTIEPGQARFIEKLFVELLRDDGGAVYINGREVSRHNLPGVVGDSAVPPNMPADATVSNEQERALRPPEMIDLSVPSMANLLRDGDNVVAVEIHQVNDTSSDLSFDLRLTATVTVSPSVLANDLERDGQAMTAILHSSPSHGTLEFSPDGTFTYISNAGFSGTDAFTYRVSDGIQASDPVIATITVRHLAPTANNEAYTASEDISLVVLASEGVLANDHDSQGHEMTAVLADPPLHGSISLASDGSFTYTPAKDYFGEDSFTYRASDGLGMSSPSTVSITVQPANDAPVARDDAYAAVATTSVVTWPLSEAGSYGEVVLASNPLAFWRLSEASGTAAIESINGFHGTYIGDVTLGRPAGRLGESDAAAEFDGQSGYVNVGFHPQLDLLSGFTVSAWIMPHTIAGDQRIIANPNAEISTAGIAFGIRDGRLRFTTYTIQDFDTQPVIVANRWQHVAVVFDQNHDASFYVDGNFVQSVAGSAPPISSPAAFKLAAGSRSFFDGLLDDVAVFEHVLSTADIQRQYRAGIGLLADSVVDFSGTQGQGGWHYGAYIRSADGDGQYQNSDFFEFPDAGGPWSSANYYDATRSTWYWHGGPPPYTYHGADIVHPNGSNNGPVHWAIRRWKSDVSGSVAIEWKLRKNSVTTLSDGVTGRVFHNGQPVDAALIAGDERSGITRWLVLDNVQEGDTIDFAVDPVGISGTPVDGADGSFFSSRLFRYTAESTTNIARGAGWKFRDNITNGSSYPTDAQGDRWIENDFNDISWPTGVAPLGYDTATPQSVQTTIGYGGNASNKHRTALFRKNFTLQDVSGIAGVVMDLFYDDGIIVYLNGREVVRENMPGAFGDATITTNSLALSANEARYMSTYIDVAKYPGLLAEGSNVVAVEVHQATADSTDLSFDLGLATLRAPVSRLAGVLANDTDIEGDPISAELVAGPSHGTFSFASDGSFTYTPAIGFVGIDEFSYRTFDGLEHSAPAKVSLVISPPSGALPGDLDFNNVVNLADLALLVGNFGLDVGGTPHPGDLDGDGRIGVRDTIVLRNCFTPASPAALIAEKRHADAATDPNTLRGERGVRRLARAISHDLSAVTDHVFASERDYSLFARRVRSAGRARF